MGCITSKKTVSITPTFDNNPRSYIFEGNGFYRRDQGDISSSSWKNRSKVKIGNSNRQKNGRGFESNSEPDDSRRESPNRTRKLSFRSSNIPSHNEAEQVAAGWPSWLSSVAGEAIQGWVPLKSDAYQKLDKIGQGTYSCVFQARQHGTGKMFALKKVQFDNYEPESVKFMAREIQILRRLDHPNIIKLEGLITSRNSTSIYLVFEYMDHDIAGLVGYPDNKFTEPQVKCYMHQLLSGLEHCHSRGVMHRDIKGANLLVNTSGCLKIADFGLAKFFGPAQKQPLTSRVVTLWYRPPELILGSTNYVASVDLWSVGCVLAELFLGKPILQGRTEIEQLHKIFKFCGSPPEEYWENIKLSNAAVFKPRRHHEGNLRKICKDFPTDAINLIETFLSVDPNKRGTALTALKSAYFKTKPYACDPSSLPKYLPSKEMDAQIREQRLRKGWSGRCGSGASRRLRKLKTETNGRNKLATNPEESHKAHVAENNDMNFQNKLNHSKAKLLADLQAVPEANSQVKDIYTEQTPPGRIAFSGPLQVSTSSGFAWAKKHREGNAASIRPSFNWRRLGPVYSPHPRNTVVNSEDPERNGSPRNKQLFSNRDEPFSARRAAFNQKVQSGRRTDSFDTSGMFHFQDFSDANDVTGGMSSNSLGYHDDEGKVDFSGPLLCQTHKVDEILENHERRISQVMRRMLFKKERKHGAK